jgi:hypothetical protein
VVRVEPSPVLAANHATARRSGPRRSFFAWHLPRTPLAGRSPENARRAPLAGTPISHACPIHLLVDGMLDPSNRALLIPPLCLASPAHPRQIPAGPASVLMAPIAPPADPKQRPALPTSPPPQLRFAPAPGTHPALLWTRATLSCEALPVLWDLAPATREAQTHRSLGVDPAEASLFLPAYTPSHPRACGADDVALNPATVQFSTDLGERPHASPRAPSPSS